MEKLLANEGLTQIVRNISRFLDPKSLAQCRLTCHSWRNTIDNDRQWIIFQLEHINKKEKIFIDGLAKDKPKVKGSVEVIFPEWCASFKAVTRRQNIPELKEFLKHMWIYFKNDSMSLYTNPFNNAMFESNIVFAQLLIKSGIDLEMKNRIGCTALHYACKYSKIEMVQLLIKSMPAFDATSGTKTKGSTIFHLASSNSNPQVVKLILDTIKFENTRDNFGRTMLHSAVKFGPKETIGFLIDSRHKFGINIKEQTNDGKTILHLACQYRNIEIVDLVQKGLEEIDSDIDFGIPLHFACVNKTPDVAIHILKRFPDKINVLGWNDLHVLHLACEFGHLELLKYIFQNLEFDVDFNVVDQKGDTPFHVACYYGQFEVVKFLLENSNEMGIDICKRNNLQQTAEDYARQKGHKEISEVLEIWRQLVDIFRWLRRSDDYLLRLFIFLLLFFVFFALSLFCILLLGSFHFSIFEL